MSLDLKKYLPKILKTEFWTDLMDGVSTELQNIINELILPKLDFWNIHDLTDNDQLIEIAKTFGYTPDRSLDSTTDFLKKDVDSLSYRVKKKSTSLSYYHIFRAIPHSGEIYPSYWDGDKLNRAYQNLDDIITHTVSKPFTLTPQPNFNAFLLGQITLDYDPILILDDDLNIPNWFLDMQLSIIPAKHLFIEYIIDKLLTESDIEYSMFISYMEFLARATEYNRKVTMVPHVGAQLTAIMDNSGEFDKGFFGDENYSSAIFNAGANLILNPRMETITNWEITASGTLSEESTYPELLPFNADQDSVLKCTLDSGITTSIYQAIELGLATNYVEQFWVYIPAIVSGDAKIQISYDTGAWNVIANIVISERDQWVLVDMPFTSNGAENTHIIEFLIDNANVKDYFYICRCQVEENNYKTAWIVDNRTAVATDFTYTMPDIFTIDLKVKPWFNYDIVSDRTIGRWEVDATHILHIYYQASSDKFILEWINGTISRTMLSDLQFDDGTNFENIKQTLRFSISLDLTTGDSTGSRFIIIPESDIASEVNTWSGNIDAYSATFPTLFLGYRGLNYIDAVYEYVKIYNQTLIGAITKTSELDNILLEKNLLKEFSLTTYSDYQYNVYSIPNIKLNAVVIPTNYALDPVATSILIGSGRYRFESKYITNAPYSTPSDLLDMVSSKTLYDNDVDAKGDWDFYKSFFQFNTIESEIVSAGDGSTIIFNGTLNFFPLEVGSLRLSYYSFPTTYTVLDQGDGTLVGDRASGTINYNTGAFTLTTEKNINITNELVANGSQTGIDYFTQHLEEGLVPGTIVLDYWVTTGSTVHYRSTDDGAGNFPVANEIASGTVNYVTGEIIVTFANPTDPNYDIVVDYTYNDKTPPDNNTNITASYAVTSDLLITEMGLKNNSGDLIAYATFPPISLGNKQYHLSPQFLIDRNGY